jgi:hypothetical protein
MLSDEGVILVRAGIGVDGLRAVAEDWLTAHSCDSRAISSGAPEELMAPWRGLERLIGEAVGGPFICNPDQSWVRRKSAPAGGQGWHQDGGLWVQYPLEPGPVPAMTALATCWIPLDQCDGSRPGLELIRRPLTHLLHFTELDDAKVRRRFAPEDFWAPRVEVGEALIFRPGVLHRTHFAPGMTRDRLSVEYRFFPAV